MSALPLKDYRILITRGKEQANRFKAAIEHYGGIPIIVPLLDFQLPSNTSKAEEAIHQIVNYDWIVLTSQNGVRFFFEMVKKYGVSGSLPKIAVIGKKTEETLIQYGYNADFIPQEFVAENFVAEFSSLLHAESRVLLAKGNLARTLIAEEINKSGASCDEVIVYESVLPKESVPKLFYVLQNQDVDVITFTSPSTIHHFMQIVEQYQLHPLLESFIIACIGPITKKTAQQYRLKVDICPNEYTTEAMLHELIIYIHHKGGTTS